MNKANSGKIINKQSIQRLQTERDLAFAISRVESLENAAGLMLNYFVHELEIDGCGMYCHDEGRKELRLLMAKGLSASFQKMVTPIGFDDPRYQLIAQGKTLLKKSEDFPDAIYSGLKKEQITSLIVVPLLNHKEELVGCVNLGLKKGKSLSESDILSIERVCFQLAAVFDRIQNELIKKRMSALEISEQRFRSLIENSSDIICIRNAKGMINYISPSVEKILGYTPKEMMAHEQECPVHPEDEKRFWELWTQILAKPGEPFQEIFRVLDRKGDIHFIDIIFVNLLDKEGIRGIITNSRDITEELQAKRLSNIQESRFRTIFEKIKLGIAICDLKRHIVDFNDAFYQMLQYTREELLAKSIDEISLPEDDLENEKLLREMLEGKTDFFTMEKRYIRKNGSILYAILSVTLIDGNQEGEKLMVGIIDDITSSKNAELEIKKRLEYEEILSKCSEELLKKVPSGKVINNVLNQLLKLSGMDRVYLYKNIEDPQEGLCMSLVDRVVYVDIDMEPSELNALTKISFKDFDIMKKALPHNKIVNETLDTLPLHKREFWKKYGIKSALVVPVFVADIWYGFLVFHDLHHQEKSTSQKMWFIKRAAEMLGAYLEKESMLKKLQFAKKNLENQVQNRTRTLKELNLTLLQENEQKARLAQELFRKEERYRILFTSAPVANLILSKNGTILEFNKEAARLLEVEEKELVHQNFKEWVMLDSNRKYINPDEFPYASTSTQKSILKGLEAGILTFDSRLKWVDVGAVPLEEEKTLLTLTDITRRKNDERRMQNLMEKDKELVNDLFFINFWLTHLTEKIDPVENIGEMMKFITHFGNFDDIAMLRILSKKDGLYQVNYAGSQDKKISSLPDKIQLSNSKLDKIRKEHRPIYIHDMEGLDIPAAEYIKKIAPQALMLYPLEIENTFYGYLVFFRFHKRIFGSVSRKLMQIIANTFSILLRKHENFKKISQLELERLQHEKMLLRTERLASLGSLVSAIGHEINQPLQSIKVIADSMLYWSGIENKKPGYDSLLENFKKISDRVKRADEIVKNMRMILQSPEHVQLEKIIMNDLIVSAAGMYQQKLRKNGITLELNLMEHQEPLLLSAIQFQQVLINLLNNALNALKVSEKDLKVIRIKTEEDSRNYFLSFEDSGPGVPDEIKEKIFNPFFSTYMGPDCIGMGLYVVSNILRSFNAGIEVRDSISGGALFILQFPKTI